MIIGLGLAPSAISQVGLASGTALNGKVIVVALVSFVVTAFVMTKAKGFFKDYPILNWNYFRIRCSIILRYD